ncbi:penicillin-binding protein 2 [Candidatus Kapabacteria bacterium]|nr:penicillin-binding protein 2 [Candidatus Kapabacteria bacterium]
MINDSLYFASKGKKNLLNGITLILCLVFISKLAYMQIFETSKYQQLSENQAIKLVRKEPIRGNIFDRNNEMLVHSQPAFSITITPSEFTKQSKTLLSSLLNTEESEVDKVLSKYKGYSRLNPIKIFKDVNIEIVSAIEEYNQYLPGVDITIESKRKYESVIELSHILGYTGEISKKRLEQKRYYFPGDDIGRNGLEYSYEDLLKGSFGSEWIAVNKFQQKVSAFDDGKLDKDAVKGFDLILHIDSKLQAKAEELLIGKVGSAVAIDVNTGGILAYASSPHFKLEDFSGRIPAKVYNQLRDNSDKPLLNRPIQGEYAPGSSWKMLVALAALEEGIITKNSTFTCSGFLKFGNRSFHCTHTDGTINVVDAIRSSCNVYFYHLGIKLGIEKIREYGLKFGFGTRTGIDLPNERDGNLPSIQTLEKIYQGYVPKGIALNWGIGQGEILTTPLQMAAYTAAIANGGTYYQPHLVWKVFNPLIKKYEVMNYKSTNIKIASDYFDIVKFGMWKVVNQGGTATNVHLNQVDICGKTSTSQNNKGKPHSWFVSFAPYKDPEVAIIAIVENGGYGSVAAAPIVREMHKVYFGIDTLQEYSNIDSILTQEH